MDTNLDDQKWSALSKFEIASENFVSAYSLDGNTVSISVLTLWPQGFIRNEGLPYN